MKRENKKERREKKIPKSVEIRGKEINEKCRLPVSEIIWNLIVTD